MFSPEHSPSRAEIGWDGTGGWPKGPGFRFSWCLTGSYTELLSSPDYLKVSSVSNNIPANPLSSNYHFAMVLEKLMISCEGCVFKYFKPVGVMCISKKNIPTQAAANVAHMQYHQINNGSPWIQYDVQILKQRQGFAKRLKGCHYTRCSRFE